MQKELVQHMVDGSEDFYFMINPYFPTLEMIDELNQNMIHLIRYYPSNQKTISEKIKRLENINLPLIAVNGSCEAIRIFLQNYSKKALVTVPNFNEWEITNHIPIRYDATQEEIKQAISQNNVDTVCICNPNNPAGHYREDIEEMATQFPNINFAIDISFIDFVDKKIPALPQGKNIVLFKSLGKNYGFCGIRLGYIASENRKLIDDMVKKIPIWNINSVAEFLIDLAIKNRGEYEESRIKIIEGTQNMYQFLKKFDFLKVFPTKANFIMVKSEKPLNFRVKCCDNKTGLDRTYYRFAYNPNFELLEKFLKNKGD
ncbi:MAG: aminotransferase class I/II-fold pyridoxal phosphate-dependent enzyme [Nanoarchaeota archaeon]|nr:aminotransferase class I/II-fold pyridoxal phosphate-dependent enzyme [Nanoarchaeota archaeon]